MHEIKSRNLLNDTFETIDTDSFDRLLDDSEQITPEIIDIVTQIEKENMQFDKVTLQTSSNNTFNFSQIANVSNAPCHPFMPHMNFNNSAVTINYNFNTFNKQ